MADSHAMPYRRVYVWELPVRVFHWINALCITVLVITGYMIGTPVTIFHSNEAYQQYWFGTVRFIHFATAYICVFNFLARAYWGLVGNRYARWDTFVPLTRRRIREIINVVRVDILEMQTRELISIGHNALAGLSYFFTFVVFLLQVATGFALYSAMSDSWFPRLFAWVVPLMGSEMAVRQWHHLFTWAFVVFIIIHVYLSVYHDYVEGRGTISAIIGGWKFERDVDLK